MSGAIPRYSNVYPLNVRQRSVGTCGGMARKYQAYKPFTAGTGDGRRRTSILEYRRAGGTMGKHFVIPGQSMTGYAVSARVALSPMKLERNLSLINQDGETRGARRYFWQGAARRREAAAGDRQRRHFLLFRSSVLRTIFDVLHRSCSLQKKALPTVQSRHNFLNRSGDKSVVAHSLLDVAVQAGHQVCILPSRNALTHW